MTESIMAEVLESVAPAESVSGVTAGDGLDDLSFLDKTLESMHSAPPAPAAPVADPVTPVEAVQPPAPKPVAPVQEPAPVDQAPAPKVDDKPVAEPAVDEETGDETSLTINQLQNRIKTSPELKALMDKDPEFRRQLFYTSRRADRAAKYDELFQTPALAQDMKRAADERYLTTELYESPEPGKFLQKLIFDSLVKDDQGRIKLENGQPVSNGHYERVMGEYRGRVYDHVKSVADEMISKNLVGDNFNGADVVEALRIVRAVLDGGSSTKTDGAASEEQLPESVRNELAQLRARNAEYDKNQASTLTSFTESVGKQMSEAVRTDVKNLLAKRLPANSAMSDYLREKVVDDTVREIERLANANVAHRDYISRTTRSVSRDDDGAKRVVNARTAFAKEIMPRLLATYLHKATNVVVADNAATRTKIQNQSRPEVASSGGVAVNPSRPDVKLAGQKVVNDARKSGRRVDDMAIVDAVLSAQGR